MEAWYYTLPNFSFNVRKHICQQAQPPTETPPCSACSFILDTEKTPYAGGQNTVFALRDHTGKEICMRVQHSPTEGSSYALEKEVNFRKAIESAGISGFQKVVGCAIKGNDLIPAPFITLEWARGTTLRWTDEFPVDIEHRNKALRAIARVTIDLLKVQENGSSAKDFVTAIINRKIQRAERNEYKGGDAEGCRRQLSLVERYWLPDLDDAPHVLVHGDLSPNNIVVDEEFNAKSVLDLGWADMIPLQFAAEYPRFLTHEPVQICPGITAFDWKRRDTDIMKRDRLYYLDCIREIACSAGGIARDYYELLARPDECRRYWWFRAVCQADIHRAMCACDWDPVEEDIS